MKRDMPTPIQALRSLQAKVPSAPAKRSGQGLPRSSSQRAQQRRQYSKEGKAYLLAHPFCQVEIFFRRLNEAAVIAADGWFRNARGMKLRIALADQLHHRNKCNGIRLINFDYIMSSGRDGHHWIENSLDEARALGLLCPINCKPDGTMPDGTKQPTTTELLASRHAAK